MSECRICLDGSGFLLSPCQCKGTQANIHISCLYKEVVSTRKTMCSICKQDYKTDEMNIVLGWTLDALDFITYVCACFEIFLDILCKGTILFFYTF
jgi:hypothetical protein